MPVTKAGTQGLGDDHRLVFSQVELRGLEPVTPACKIGPGCRKQSLTWSCGPERIRSDRACQILLWSGLVASVGRGAQVGGAEG
jgi:hypothetical protein